METQEQVKAMDGKTGSEDGMMLNGTFYTMAQWPGIVEEINGCLTQTGAKKMLKKAKSAKMTWTWKVSLTHFGGELQYTACKSDINFEVLS